MKSRLLHLIIMLMISVVAYVGYSIWYSTVAAQSARIIGLQNKIASNTKLANRIASARAALIELASDEITVHDYFVPETGVVSFIEELEALGKAQGASVDVLSVSSNLVAAKQVLSLALTVKGTFDAVMRTTGAIEYAPYALSVSGLSLAQTDKNNWYANLRITVGSVRAATSTPPKTATSTP